MSAYWEYPPDMEDDDEGSGGWAWKLLAVALVTGAIVVGVVMMMLLSTGGIAGAVANEGQCVTEAGELDAVVPQPMNSVFTKAANHYQIDPELEAAIYVAEWNPADEKIIFRMPPEDGRTWASSPAGAQGPFQFMPGTWIGYQSSNPEKPVGDINNLVDGAFAAAHYLSDLGATVGMPLGSVSNPDRKGTVINVAASYNAGPAGNFRNPETQRYIRKVAQVFAALKGQSDRPAGMAGPKVESDCQPGTPVGDVTCRELADDPRVQLTDNARSDLLNGFMLNGKKTGMDPRVCNWLGQMASQWPIYVTTLKTGHNQFVAGSNRVSNHWEGRGADVFGIGGKPAGVGGAYNIQPVTPSNQDAKAAAEWTLEGTVSDPPTELGQPWFPAPVNGIGAFTDAAHQDHLHGGWTGAG